MYPACVAMRCSKGGTEKIYILVKRSLPREPSLITVIPPISCLTHITSLTGIALAVTPSVLVDF